MTRTRFRIYAAGIDELVDFSLTDPDTLRRIDASIDGSGRLNLRIPRGTGRGRNARARANRRIRITTPRAREILDLIRNAQIAVFEHE